MRAIKAFFRIIFFIVLIFSLIASLMFLAFRNIIFSPDRIADYLTGHDYGNVVVECVREEIENKAMLLELGGEIFNDSISDSEIISCAKAYIRSIASHFTDGTDVVPADFQSDGLYQEIARALDEYAAANNVGIEEGSQEKIYSTMCSAVSSKINMISSEYIQKGIPIISGLRSYVRYGYIFCAAAMLSFVILFLLDIKKLSAAVYSSAAAVWCGAALGFIPALLFRIYNFPEKTALARSPLKELIRNATGLILGRILLFFGIVLLLSGALLAISIFVCAKKAAKEGEQRRGNSPGSETSGKNGSGKKNKKSSAHGGKPSKQKNKKTDGKDDNPRAVWDTALGEGGFGADDYNEDNDLYETMMFLDQNSRVPEYYDPEDSDFDIDEENNMQEINKDDSQSPDKNN